MDEKDYLKMLNLQLEKPLVFFDIESTGTNVMKDRIVELAMIKLFPEGKMQEATLLINPMMPIPPESSEVHGIYDEDVADKPHLAQVADNILEFIGDADLAGYNIIKFDVPMLENEFARVGVKFSTQERRLIDVYNIFCKMFPRTLTGAYKYFCGRDLENAHSAAADTFATFEVFCGEMAKYPELPRDLDELHEFCDMTDPDVIDKAGRFKWRGDQVIVNFGKHSGELLKDIAQREPGFLQWIIRSDFANDTKNIARDALIGRFPKRE